MAEEHNPQAPQAPHAPQGPQGPQAPHAPRKSSMSCDPTFGEQYVQHDYDAPAARGDIDASKAGLPEDVRAFASDYMMSPYGEAANAVCAYEPMWAQVSDRSDTMNTTQQMRAYKWLLYEAQITKKKNTDKSDTHKALNNGKFHIPAEAEASRPQHRSIDEANFLKCYAHARLLGLRQFFVETRTPVFRFYMDLDFKQPAPLAPRNMEVAAFVICRTIRRFWPQRAEGDPFFRCIVSTTTYKNEKGHSEGAPSGQPPALPKIKSGVHLIWPDILLNDTMALNMRETVIADLQDTFGPRSEPTMNSWSDVVDLSVYKGSGLRMIGSCKTEPCGLCRRKGVDDAGAPCTACGGNRTVDSGRPYMPLLVLDGSGRRDKAAEEAYRKSFYKVVLDTKIRTALSEAPDTGFCIPEGAPLYADGLLKRGKGGGGGGGGGGVAASASSACKTKLDAASSEVSMVQTFLRSFMGGGKPYAQIVVHNVLANAKRNKYIVNVLGFNATFCQNVGRCHRSNRVFFEIAPEGCVQRCYDPSETIEGDMRYGLCRDYRSALVRLPPAILAALFPDLAAKQDALDTAAAGMGLVREGVSTGEGPNGLGGGTHASPLDDVAFAELDMRHDIKMRALLAAGDSLSMALHGCEWSSTLLLPSAAGSRKRMRMLRLDGGEKFSKQAFAEAALGKCSLHSLPMYAEIDPAALGSRADEALKTLGFAVDADPAAANAGIAGIAGITSPIPHRGPPNGATSRMVMDRIELTLTGQLMAIINLAFSIDLSTAVAALSGPTGQGSGQGSGHGFEELKRRACPRDPWTDLAVENARTDLSTDAGGHTSAHTQGVAAGTANGTAVGTTSRVRYE
jgi:hypothetical protein